MVLERTFILLLDIYLRLSILPFILLIFQIHFCCGKSKSKHEATDKQSVKNVNFKTSVKEFSQKTKSSYTKDKDKNHLDKSKSKNKICPQDEGKITKQDAKSKIPDEKQIETAESDKNPKEDSPDFPPPPPMNELFRMGASDFSDLNDESTSDDGKHGLKAGTKQTFEKEEKIQAGKPPMCSKDEKPQVLLQKEDDKNLENRKSVTPKEPHPLMPKMAPQKAAKADQLKRITRDNVNHKTMQKKLQSKEPTPFVSKSKVVPSMKTAELAKD